MAKSDRKTRPMGAMIEQGHARLTVVSGSAPEGLTWGLSGTSHVAGRSSGDISLSEDKFVSPEHATFLYRDGQLVVTDIGSTNGVYLRIRGPHSLQSGDWFRVGSQYFVFESLEQKDSYESSDGTHHFISPVRKGGFRIQQVLEGGKPGLSHTASSDEITIGGDGANIALPADNHLSSSHARVYAAKKGYALEDTDSTNGTYVRIRGEAALTHGDYVIIGDEVLRVDVT